MNKGNLLENHNIKGRKSQYFFLIFTKHKSLLRVFPSVIDFDLARASTPPDLHFHLGALTSEHCNYSFKKHTNRH